MSLLFESPFPKLLTCGKFFPRVILLTVYVVFVFLVFYSMTKIRFYSKHRSDNSTNINVTITVESEDEYNVSRFRIRKNYRILANFITANRTFEPEESITYVAHGEYPYLDNLIAIVGRWDGPISISVFAPGWDFKETLRRIYYLRNCVKKPEIKQRVTFHIYFPRAHAPPKEFFTDPTSYMSAECLPWLDHKGIKFGPELMKRTYRKRSNLMYPINLGRNIAQEEAKTKYVLGSDLELYPSPRDLIPKFLRFVESYEKTAAYHPTSYVLPVFEIHESVPLTPSTKTDLQDLYTRKLAYFFHKNVCWYCHFPPNHEKWIVKEENQDNVGVFTKIKRQGIRWGFWEPFSITLRNTPPYDERLMKEMFMDRVPREYSFCLLNYDYVVLDNAFLVHRPGIRANNHHKNRKVMMRQYKNIKLKYKSQYLEVYGNTNKNICYI